MSKEGMANNFSDTEGVRDPWDSPDREVFRVAMRLHTEEDLIRETGISIEEMFATAEPQATVVWIGFQAQLLDLFEGAQITSMDGLPIEGLKQIPLAEASASRLILPDVFSVHLAGGLEATDFKAVAKEMARILKSSGKAYIFPTEDYLSDEAEFDWLDLELGFAEESWYREGDLKTKIVQDGNHDVLVVEKLPKLSSVDKVPEGSRSTRRVSRHAIGDAMVIAYGLDEYGEPFKRPSPTSEPMSPEEIDRWTSEKTRSQCIINSRKTIEYLAEKYPDHFDRLLVLVASVNSEENPFRNESGKHAVFVARDLSGRWYAGSPANYNPSEARSNPLSSFVEANSLEELLTMIQEAEGGETWGTASFIERELNYIHPRARSRSGRQDYRLITVVLVYEQDGQVMERGDYWTKRSS